MKLFLPVILTLILPGSVAAADTLQYAMQHYTDENGLPQNSIKAITPDESGFLWLATENGLVRFDGHGFNAYNKNNLTVTSSRITHLLRDSSRDVVYAITEKNQVLRATKGRVVVTESAPFPEEAIKNVISGNVDTYVARGLPNIYGNHIHFLNYCIPVDGQQRYVITRREVQLFKGPDRLAAYPFPVPDFWKFFLVNQQLYYLDGHHVYSFNQQQGGSKGTLTGDIQKHPAWHNARVQPVLYWNMLSESMLIALENALYRVEKSANGELTTRLVLAHFDFQGNKIITAYDDAKHQRLFLGSHTRGLYAFKRKHFYTLNANDAAGDRVYYAQTLFRNNSVLTAQGEVLGLSAPPAFVHNINKYVPDDRTSILTDSSGNIWIKHLQKLFQFSADGNSLLRSWELPHPISQLYEFEKGTLLAGTKSGYTYQIHYPNPNATPSLAFQSLSDVTYFMRESEQILWVGTGKGLHRVHYKTGRIDTVPGLMNKHIRSLYMTGEKELWVTTYEEGFFLYHQNKLTKFPLDKGKYLSASHCILEDNSGYFWITTNKGIFQVLRNDLLAYARGTRSSVYYHYYDRQSGFNTNEFNGGCQPCGLMLPNGFLSFPSMNGMVWVKPSSFSPELPDKGLFIDNVEIDGKPLPFTDSIKVEDRFDFFKLVVTTPYFGNEYNIHLQFALVKDGHSPVWNTIGTDRSITLSSLSSGCWKLMIRKENGFGDHNFTTKTFSLQIAPAYYETWWFRITIALLLIAAVWAYIRFRLYNIQRTNKVLERRIDERTQTLLNTLTNLQLSEERLRRQTYMQDRLITAITHDIKSPLKYMTMAAKRLYDHSVGGEQDQQEIQKNAHMLFEAGYRMYHLTDNMLQYLKLNARDMQINFEKVNVFEIVENKISIFREIAAEQGTTLVNELSPYLSVRSNTHLLSIVIHNLLDNAIKVTYDGKVMISSIMEDRQLHILMTDTGVGMMPDMVQWCNKPSDMFEQNPAEKSFPGHSGFGLIIVKELVSLMDGKISVTSSHEEGTTVKLTFATLAAV